MSRQRARKECVETLDYLNRFGRALARCVADGMAQKTGEDEAKPIYKVDSPALEAAMATEFADYRFGNSDPKIFVSNDADTFEVEVAISYMRQSLRGEGRKPLMTIVQEEREGAFMGRDMNALDAISATMAIEPAGELSKPGVRVAYMNEIESLPDVRRTFQDSVAVVTINTAVLEALKTRAATPGTTDLAK